MLGSWKQALWPQEHDLFMWEGFPSGETAWKVLISTPMKKSWTLKDGFTEIHANQEN